MLAVYSLCDDVPGEYFVKASLSVKVKSRFKANLSTSGFQAGTVGQQRQGFANTTVAAGQETLYFGMAQRFEIQLDVRQRTQTLL
jgi:hypothetical protein